VEQVAPGRAVAVPGAPEPAAPVPVVLVPVVRAGPVLAGPGVRVRAARGPA